MSHEQQRQPFKRTKLFKALVLCVYVYSCIQLDPFDGPLSITLTDQVHAEESMLEQKMKEKLTNLILAFFQD